MNYDNKLSLKKLSQVKLSQDKGNNDWLNQWEEIEEVEKKSLLDWKSKYQIKSNKSVSNIEDNDFPELGSTKHDYNKKYFKDNVIWERESENILTSHDTGTIASEHNNCLQNEINLCEEWNKIDKKYSIHISNSEKDINTNNSNFENNLITDSQNSNNSMLKNFQSISSDVVTPMGKSDSQKFTFEIDNIILKSRQRRQEIQERQKKLYEDKDKIT